MPASSSSQRPSTKREKREREREHSPLLAVYFEGENESKFPPLHPREKKEKDRRKIHTEDRQTHTHRERERDRESKMRNEKSARTSSVVHHFSSFATDERAGSLGEKILFVVVFVVGDETETEAPLSVSLCLSFSLEVSKGGT